MGEKRKFLHRRAAGQVVGLHRRAAGQVVGLHRRGAGCCFVYVRRRQPQKADTRCTGNRQLSAAASRSQQPRKQPQPAADDCIQSQPPVADDCIQPQPVAAASRQPQMTAYSRRQHRIGAARIASVRLPLAIRMSGEGLYARQHKKPLSMTGKTVRLRGFRAYIKALSFLSIVLLLKSSFVFGEDCIFDFVPRF